MRIIASFLNKLTQTARVPFLVGFPDCVSIWVVCLQYYLGLKQKAFLLPLRPVPGAASELLSPSPEGPCWGLSDILLLRGLAAQGHSCWDRVRGAREVSPPFPRSVTWHLSAISVLTMDGFQHMLLLLTSCVNKFSSVCICVCDLQKVNLLLNLSPA